MISNAPATFMKVSLLQTATLSIQLEKLKKYFFENKYIFIYSLLLAIFSYGYELFNFSMSIDEEVDSFRDASTRLHYIVIGRWGLYILDQFINQSSVLPFIPTLIALICIAGASAVYISSQQTNLSGKLIFSTIFITSPIHSYYLGFSTSGLYYTMGMVMTVLAFLAFRKAISTGGFGIKYFLLAIIFIGLSLTLYQALIAFFMVFVVFFFFNKALNDTIPDYKFYLKSGASLLVVCGLGFLFYKTGDIIAKQILIEPLHIEYESYLDNFIAWGRLPAGELIVNLGKLTFQYITGDDSGIGVAGLSLKSIIVLIPFIFYFITMKVKRVSNYIFSYSLFLILLLSPFSLVYACGSQMPARTLMALPLMIALLWLFTYQQVGSFLRKILVVAAITVLINNTYLNTRLFYSTYVTWQADRDLANRIIERIYNLDPPLVNGKIQVAFVGYKHRKANDLFFNSEIHGASFFEWGFGHPGRINDLFRTNGIEELNPIFGFEGIKANIKSMPAWPSKGSVGLVDNIVIVKLSEPFR